MNGPNGPWEAASPEVCGCCPPDLPEASIENPPGLPALAYRIGTHGDFLRRLIARLPKWTIPDGDHAQQRPLARLTTRATDDPAIALLDVWALVGDVVTFYQERISNEGFLRTAVERRSVLELARAIGYGLDPGLAASAWLAFTVDDGPQSPAPALIPAGTQIQSIPQRQDELPQTFETRDDFPARAEWNRLIPRRSRPLPIERGIQQLYLEGVTTNLSRGDAILLVGDERLRFPGSERWDVRVLTDVIPDPEHNVTRVAWTDRLGHEHPTVEPAAAPRVYAFRRRAALFGHNAPDYRAMPDSIKEEEDWQSDTGQWPNFSIQTASDFIIDLDTVYPAIIEGSWIFLSKSSYVELYLVTNATVDSRTDFTLTSKVTRLKLDSREHLTWFPLRETVVYAESEELDLAGRPIDDPVGGRTIEVEGRIEGLQPDHVLIISGVSVADTDVSQCEVAVIEAVAPDETFTEIRLQQELEFEYERSSVTIHANVVLATHGETVRREVLGSGDGTKAFQSFRLQKSPLTYVSSTDGSDSTLEVRVDGVQWQQRASLYGADATHRCYTVRIDDEARVRLVFGDGRSGARLPTGQENVVATYRNGIGRDGNVGAKSLMLLKTRPLGIRGVTNPAAAAGGEEPERLQDARRNAPVTVQTLDRVVSLHDYENYARAFPGISKARADSVWIGESNVVHVTVAAAGGDSVNSELLANLFAAIASRREPLQPVRLSSFMLLQFDMAARVLIDAAYEWGSVEAELRHELDETFSFHNRQFGQPVSAAEVLRVMHAVSGVVAVDLDVLQFSESSVASGASVDPGSPTDGDDGTPSFSNIVLQARSARLAGSDIQPAELLLIHTDGLQLREFTS